MRSSPWIQSFLQQPLTVSNDLFDFTILSCMRTEMTCREFCRRRNFNKRLVCSEPVYPREVKPGEHVWDMLRVQYMLHNKYDWPLEMPSFYDRPITALLYDENLLEVSPQTEIPYSLPFCAELQPLSSREAKPGTRAVREERIGYPPGHDLRQIRFQFAIPIQQVGMLTKTSRFWMVFEVQDGELRCVDDAHADVLSITSRIADVRASRKTGLLD